MKNLVLMLVLFIIGFYSYSQTKEYGEGFITSSVFDLEKRSEIKESIEKIGDIIKLVKTSDSYVIYYKWKGGISKMTFKKLNGFNVEDYEYIKVDEGHKYVLKDMLDTSVKYLQVINTVDLPNVSNKYKMMLTFLIN